ncbi:MAG: hypothetical protein QGH83_16280 [Candidatus Pacebacteria bacterium]|jgi:hypothetical protein|nr:hypothetical protein [Candidatus Paceibacterota bacterium]|tara:strand:- start:413 stop:823 length:411 start_codon:yes stop_codon:yes gene_type:complete
MNQESPYKIVKLVNGEDIICMIEDDGDTSYKIIWPLKMQVLPKMTKDGGILESLNLSTWIQSYTEERTFNLPLTSVIMMAEASPGLSKYYEFVLRKLKQSEDTPQASDTIWDADYQEEEVYDELLEEEESPSKLIH